MVSRDTLWVGLCHRVGWHTGFSHLIKIMYFSRSWRGLQYGSVLEICQSCRSSKQYETIKFDFEISHRCHLL